MVTRQSFWNQGPSGNQLTPVGNGLLFLSEVKETTVPLSDILLPIKTRAKCIFRCHDKRKRMMVLDATESCISLMLKIGHDCHLYLKSEPK